MAETSLIKLHNLDATDRRAPLRNFDVFLNHRGPDVKRGFVSHLHSALKASGIQSFVDYEDLSPGENTWDEIVSAIRHSKVHIAIFSRGYASSAWCLDELHEILQCRRNGSSQGFLPVFFNVQPHELRYLSSPKSRYGKALAKLTKHEQHNHPDVICKWKKALYEASMELGWTFDSKQGFEADLVKDLVSKVLDIINPTLLDVAKYPVAVEERLQEALGLMKPPNMLQGLQTFGIYGMGGVGKTTLAKSIYNAIHRDFDGFCFIESVRSKALDGLPKRVLGDLLKKEFKVDDISHGKQLMRERCAGLKILLILDDVNDREQLEVLLTPFESCHLKDGSQVVITTQDEEIVSLANIEQKLCMEGLSEAHAHLLFNWHAFLRKEKPPQEFEALAKKVVDACGGLPLALEILGGHLYNKGMPIWEATVKVLEGGSGDLPSVKRKVTKHLRISFDGLGKTEQSMFLDVACFMLGESEELARRVWSDSDAAELCFETLRRKSLVKVDECGRLAMHDLLRDMGREIVVEEHEKVWERSHLWDARDVRRVLQRGKGASELRALSIDKFDLEESRVLSSEDIWQCNPFWDLLCCLGIGQCRHRKYGEFIATELFAGMDSLKFLSLSTHGIKIRGDFGLFPKELTWFRWCWCPLQSLPRELDLSKVAVLDLEGSDIVSLSNGHKFESLRELRLVSGRNFSLPNFGDCCNRLEVLNLRRCLFLDSVPESIGCLSSSLTRLDLGWCRKLTMLPSAVGQLTRLEVLDLSYCSGLTSVPESIGCLSSSLTQLDLRWCEKLTMLPDAIGQLTRLKEIGLDALSSLVLLPPSLGNLTQLSSLCLREYRSLEEIPSTIGNLSKVSSLILTNSRIREIPAAVTSLTNLVELEISGCRSMVGRPLEEFGNLRMLVQLRLSGNERLSHLPPSIGQLKNLETLALQGCDIDAGGLPEELWNLPSLMHLDLGGNPFSTLPVRLHFLSKLQTLALSRCRNLREVPPLPSSLVTLDTRGCSDLREVCLLPPLLKIWRTRSCPALTRLCSSLPLPLEELDVGGCGRLDISEVCSQLAGLTSLRWLDLVGTGVSLGPWIEALVSLDAVLLDGESLPECFIPYKLHLLSVEHPRLFVIDEEDPQRSDEYWNCLYEVPRTRDIMECKGLVLSVAFSRTLLSVEFNPFIWRPSYKSRCPYLDLYNSRLVRIIRTTAEPWIPRYLGAGYRCVIQTTSKCVPEVAVKLVWEDHEFEDILAELARTKGGEPK